MDYEDLITTNKTLQEEINKLKNENNDLKEHLKKYTAPPRSKTYYENHKEEINNKTKQDPNYKEKRKEYNKISYLRRKEKLEKEKSNNENI
jgi:hypothetical protein